ncbi:MAG: flagellar biosynthetic protein FliR [Pseudomonadota bacterium]
MTLDIAHIVEGVAGLSVAFGLVFLRAGAIMAVLPAFGEQFVPMRVRLVATLAFAVLVAPAVSDAAPPLLEAGKTWPTLVLNEVLAGLMLGLAVRLLVLALVMAGTMAATAMSLTQLLGGAAVDPQPAMSGIFWLAGLALAAQSGLHVNLVTALAETYDILPIGKGFESGDLAEWGTARVTHAFALAFTFAAPFVIASVVYNAALGAINRAMPTLMVAFVGAPAITGGALVLMALTLPFILPIWLGVLDRTLSAPFMAP